MFSVYILYSPSSEQTYTGQTQNISQRLERHNKGMVQSTRRNKPWILVYSESYLSKIKVKKQLKNGKGNGIYLFTKLF